MLHTQVRSIYEHDAKRMDHSQPLLVDLYVKLDTGHAATPQIRYVQAGERATAITWNICGTGKITNLNLASSQLLPISVMVQTNGIIQEQGASSQYIDCLNTFHVLRADAQNKTIMHVIDRGDLKLKVILSPFADLRTDEPLRQYKSDHVERITRNISNGNISIKTCIAMLTSGVSLSQATDILNGKPIQIDASKKGLVRRLKCTELESDSSASIGLNAMHHTVVTKTLAQTQLKLPINLKHGFFLLLQARKYCHDSNITITADNIEKLQPAVRLISQVGAAKNAYKYDTTLGTKSVEFGSNKYFSMDKQTDIQHATLRKMASHVMFDRVQMEQSKRLNVSLSGSLQNTANIGDCEDFAFKIQEDASAMQAPHRLLSENSISSHTCHDTVKALLFDQSYTCTVPELERITQDCMLLSRALHETMQINACIGLAGAANLQSSSDQQHAQAPEQDVEAMLGSGEYSGHAWGCELLQKHIGPPIQFVHHDSGCKVTMRFHSGPITCHEGTSAAFTDPDVTLTQDVQFKLNSNIQQSTGTATFQQKICKLNNKIMPQFMAISLASTIHQTFIADAYQFSARAVSTQPPIGNFYKAVIAMNDKDCACTLFQTTKQNASSLQANPSVEALSAFMQNTTFGYIPHKDSADKVNVLLQVEPLDPAYHLAIDAVAESLATRALHPAELEEHYEKCMQTINQQHGVNMPLTPYAVNLMTPQTSFPQKTTSLKFTAMTNEETVQQMVQDNVIKTYVSISPGAHLCSL